MRPYPGSNLDKGLPRFPSGFRPRRDFGASHVQSFGREVTEAGEGAEDAVLDPTFGRPVSEQENARVAQSCRGFPREAPEWL